MLVLATTTGAAVARSPFTRRAVSYASVANRRSRKTGMVVLSDMMPFREFDTMVRLRF